MKGCLEWVTATAMAVAVVIGSPVVWFAVRNAQADHAARAACRPERVFEVRRPDLVRLLEAARLRPENIGKALVQTPIANWKPASWNASLLLNDFPVSFHGTTVYLVHDIATAPRGWAVIAAMGRFMDVHCLPTLNDPRAKLVFAQ